MTVDTGTVVPRSQISLGVEPTLRGSLAQLANGRVLVIDYFASRRCGVVIGDLTVDFGDEPPGPAYVELAGIESGGSSQSQGCSQSSAMLGPACGWADHPSLGTSRSSSIGRDAGSTSSSGPGC